MQITRPSKRQIRAVLEDNDAAFSYDEVGLTASLMKDPSKLDRKVYDFDSNTFSLGEGQSTFDRASRALLRWAHFGVPWIEFHQLVPEAHEDQVVATLLSHFGFWFLNPCRVVYMESSERHTAFAYGTLAGHAEIGEERFGVRIDAQTGAVAYQIQAFSRPGTIATQLAYPFARQLQARFAQASGAAMQAAVRTP